MLPNSQWSEDLWARHANQVLATVGAESDELKAQADATLKAGGLTREAHLHLLDRDRSAGRKLQHLIAARRARWCRSRYEKTPENRAPALRWAAPPRSVVLVRDESIPPLWILVVVVAKVVGPPAIVDVLIDDATEDKSRFGFGPLLRWLREFIRDASGVALCWAKQLPRCQIAPVFVNPRKMVVDLRPCSGHADNHVARRLLAEVLYSDLRAIVAPDNVCPVGGVCLIRCE